MCSRRSVGPEVNDHANIGSDEKGAWARRLWSQGNRWMASVRRLPRRSNKAIKTWIDASVDHRHQIATRRKEIVTGALDSSRIAELPDFERFDCMIGNLSAWRQEAMRDILESCVTAKLSFPMNFESLDGSSPVGRDIVARTIDSYMTAELPKSFECLCGYSPVGPKNFKSECGSENYLDDHSSYLCDSGYASVQNSPPCNLKLDTAWKLSYPGVEAPLTPEYVSPYKDTALNEAFGTPIQSSNTSPSSDYSLFSDRSPVKPTVRENDSESSIGATTESDSSEDNQSLSPENDAWVTMAYAKHRMMVSLMRDVYTIFNPQWRVDFSCRTGSQAASTGAGLQNSSSSTPSSTARGKRRVQDRHSNIPDADDDNKPKARSPNPEDVGQRRFFACCFYKYNAQKYCSNSYTGTKYRSCAGPGFSKVSQLKQHLKRNHRAPIYCPRCWLVMKSQTEMNLHANAEERCERREPQAQEGVDQDKMRLITEIRGVSWERIYEILFPGAPIPSPYYEDDDLSPGSFEPLSPRSQELRAFEVYNRTTLPLLVEANLRAIVEAEIAPIEEHVRAMVVDIVRNCQSTVARNFHYTIAPAALQSSSQGIASNENGGRTHQESPQLFVDGTAGDPMGFFQEPPHLNMEASISAPVLMHNQSSVTGSQDTNLDSGYASLPQSCGCSCHDYSNTWNAANGRSSCQSCALTHVDPGGPSGWDPGSLYNDFD